MPGGIIENERESELNIQGLFAFIVDICPCLGPSLLIFLRRFSNDWVIYISFHSSNFDFNEWLVMLTKKERRKRKSF